MTIMYGITNCDSVKKARKFFLDRHTDYQFIDLRKDEFAPEVIAQAAQYIGWEKLLNKRSTTWKQLDSSIKENVDSNNVLDLLLAYPTLIKRPLVQWEDAFTVGFNAEIFDNKIRGTVNE